MQALAAICEELRARTGNPPLETKIGEIFMGHDQRRGYKSEILKLSRNSIQGYAFPPSRRREAPCEGTNSPRLFTPGETKALAKSKVHQISRAWVTTRGWSSSLISKIWRTVMNSEHCDWSNLKCAL